MRVVVSLAALTSALCPLTRVANGFGRLNPFRESVFVWVRNMLLTQEKRRERILA